MPRWMSTTLNVHHTDVCGWSMIGSKNQYAVFRNRTLWGIETIAI